MQTRKHTAWKKNRKFGDIYGGRLRVKLKDNVFNRKHDIVAPQVGESKPIFIIDNPSRDFYYPISKEEVLQVLDQLPVNHTVHLTHIWFQKNKKSEYQNGESFQCAFICGSGIYLIVLSSFPRDNKMRFGKDKPSIKTLNHYKNFSVELKEDKHGWFLQWSEDQIKRYYLHNLLLYNIGQSLDSFYKRFWSKAYYNKMEKWAKNYVCIWANQVKKGIEFTVNN